MRDPVPAEGLFAPTGCRHAPARRQLARPGGGRRSAKRARPDRPGCRRAPARRELALPRRGTAVREGVCPDVAARGEAAGSGRPGRPGREGCGVAVGTARPGRRETAGQTLVEVLVAMVVLGVGLLSVMRAFGTCGRSIGVIHGETMARAFAASMVATARENPGLLLKEETGRTEGPQGVFNWSRRLRETDSPGVLAVEVEVTWSVQGLRRRYSLVTAVEAPGAYRPPREGGRR